MNKNNQRGFIAFVVVIILALAVAGGGVYYMGVKKGAKKVIDDVNMADGKANATSSVNINNSSSTEGSAKVDANMKVMTNTMILGALNYKAATRARGYALLEITKDQFENPEEAKKIGSYETANIRARGDVNGDGYEDALVVINVCGGSCGNYPTIILNNKDGTAYLVASFPGYITGGAGQHSFSTASIKNGIISMTIGSAGSNLATKQYRLEGNTIVEVSSANVKADASISAFTDDSILTALNNSGKDYKIFRIAAGEFGNQTTSTPKPPVEDIKVVARGDVNDDGYEDVVVAGLWCWASCGNSLGVIINSGGKEAVSKYLDSGFPGWEGSGAGKTTLKTVVIKDGIISVTAQNFNDFKGTSSDITRRYRVEGTTIVEVK